MSDSENSPRLLAAARQYWSGVARKEGIFPATSDVLSKLWEFARDSTPWRLRQRFGDAEYDWEYRVNTTSGAVGWRDRLLGMFHSPYQPTEPVLFHEMLRAVCEQGEFDPAEFTFIDLGSGKGRTLLMAADYPFRRIIGVEILPALHAIAEGNVAKYKSDSQKCFAVECVCGDATSFALPEEPLILYLFNPFPEAGLRRVMAAIHRSLAQKPRRIYVLYHNPQLESVLTESGQFKEIAGTHQYSIFRSGSI